MGKLIIYRDPRNPRRGLKNAAYLVEEHTLEEVLFLLGLKEPQDGKANSPFVAHQTTDGVLLRLPKPQVQDVRQTDDGILLKPPKAVLRSKFRAISWGMDMYEYVTEKKAAFRVFDERGKALTIPRGIFVQ